MVPQKARGSRLCTQCGLGIGREPIVLERSGKYLKRFCSEKCLNEHFEGLFLSELNRRVSKETNLVYGLVCPACKARLRRQLK